MQTDTFEAFKAYWVAQGYPEVLVREWLPGQLTGVHTHPFDVQAEVKRGEVWLTCGDTTRHISAGGSFDLLRDVPHNERYGPEGATFWVARR
jgi:quercetin dioxygenase-like cupin family protein